MVADSTRRRRSERTSRPAPHEDSAAESPKRTQPARRTKLVTKDSTEDLAQTSEDNGTYLLEDDFTGESRVVDPRVASGRKMNFQQLDRLPLHEKLRPEDEDDMDIAEEGNGGIANGHDKVYEDGLAPKAAATGILGDDFPNFVLLLLLYCLQGVPLGLTFGSIPYLLKSRLSYHELAIFSIASYPYSLKLLWSPIVDAYFIRSIGRRKSWIIPIQTCIAFLLIFLGTQVDSYLEMETVPVNTITALFLLLVFLSATQDIAVDGWALTLLAKENLSYASTAQTIGLNTGYFLSFTVFLALNSHEFCNKYLRSIPKEVGLIELGAYLQFWGISYLIATIFLTGKKERLDDGVEDVRTVYKTMWNICTMSNMRTLIVVLLVSKIGFITNEIVTGLKLLELGFSREDLALAVLCDFPLEIVFGYYAARWSSGDKPLVPWLTAFYGRLACSVLGMLVIYIFPVGGAVGRAYFTLVITSTVLTSFMSTIQFVSIGCFFARISDPSVGGTYMTLLNTVSNLGGTWPKALVLQLVDYFTRTACIGATDGDGLGETCATEALRDSCKAAGGSCEVLRDGYYVVNWTGVVLGTAIFLAYVKPRVKRLEMLGPKQWRVPDKREQ